MLLQTVAKIAVVGLSLVQKFVSWAVQEQANAKLDGPFWQLLLVWLLLFYLPPKMDHLHYPDGVEPVDIQFSSSQHTDEDFPPVQKVTSEYRRSQGTITTKASFISYSVSMILTLLENPSVHSH
jgi:hypothetical protein